MTGEPHLPGTAGDAEEPRRAAADRSSLVRGRSVICGVNAAGEAEVVEDGAVFQRGGTIVEVGPYETLLAKYRPREIVGSADDVVLPGLVNSHHHVGLTPLQLGTPDLPLELWILRRRASRAVDPYLDTLYSAFEMISSGVTAVHHIHAPAYGGQASRWLEQSEAVLRAYRDIGMRVCYSAFARDQHPLVYAPDEELIAGLPPGLAAEARSWAATATVRIDRLLEEHFLPLWERNGRNRGDRVRILLAPANLQWCSDQALQAMGEWAERLGVGMHMHLLETVYQREYARRRTGTTAVGHLAELGLLGPRMTLGHAVWVSDDDVELMAETGTYVCHNASSNLRLQSGRAPLNRLLARGVRVTLGLDEAGINDDRDMLQEMRLVLNLHREPGIGGPAPRAGQVLQMATEHAAATAGFGERLGRLEPGRSADLVLLDWGQIAFPYLDPDVPVLEAALYRGRTSAVRTVLIGGEPVLVDGRFTRLDRQEVLDELARALRSPLTPEELRRREAARRILPFAARFYRRWAGGRAPT